MTHTNRTRGENHYNATLTNQQVAHIRWLYEHERDQWTQPALARAYGVTRSCIAGLVYWYNRTDVEAEMPEREA